MTLREMTMAVQAKLGLAVDGLAGPATWGAIYRRIVEGEKKPKPALSDVSVVLDSRSERVIDTLLPQVRPYARALVHACAEQDITVVVTSGLRTYAEQDALYNQGRTQPGTVVTAARGGHSNHNFGIAFDVTIFDGKKPVWESPLYNVVGALGRGLGLTWGGDWKSFVDKPHFELRPAWAAKMGNKEMLAELRSRQRTGTPIFS